MTLTKIYLSTTEELDYLRKETEVITLQRGCGPVSLSWNGSIVSAPPDRYEDQFDNAVSKCQVLVGILGSEYGVSSLRLRDSSRVSPMHFEMRRARELQPGPQIWLFSLATEKDCETQRMLKSLRSEPVECRTEAEFHQKFSMQLAQYRQELLLKHLSTLERVRFTVTCPDEAGLLAKVTAVIRDLKGSLAGGTQMTSGRLAILHFVAEWEVEFPGKAEIKKRVGQAIPNLTEFVSSIISQDEPPLTQKLLTLEVQFIDQPGVASYVFEQIYRVRNWSVFQTHLDTTASGGLMLGRIVFSVDGDHVTPEEMGFLTENLRMLPGILRVGQTIQRGRYWR